MEKKNYFVSLNKDLLKTLKLKALELDIYEYELIESLIYLGLSLGKIEDDEIIRYLEIIKGGN